jgi:type IV secretory pathway ATPase VirB11/archaellum biosynthesis ATPase
MKIGGFEVGPYTVKEEGGKKHLIFSCKDCVYSASLANDAHCRFHILTILQKAEADLVVLADVYERVYDEEKSKQLKEIADLIGYFRSRTLWTRSFLGDLKEEPETALGPRHDEIMKITYELLSFDPVKAYLRCLSALKREMQKQKSGGSFSKIYIQTLQDIKQAFERVSFIEDVKQYLVKLEKIPETNELYRHFFEAEVKPSFIGSRLMFEHEIENFELLDEYPVGKSTVQIFNHPNKIAKLYFINPPEYSLSPQKYFLLSKTKEVVSGYTPGQGGLSDIGSSRSYFNRVYQATIRDLAKQYQIKMEPEEVEELAEVVSRYTVGYGILELLLGDRKITDVFLDSPIGGKPIYITHAEFGQCLTNILYTETEAEGFVSKLRAMSGRPFDEAHPVLDFDLPGQETRVASIGKPLSPDGLAFAFRLHKTTPWTLEQFIDNKFISPLASGLLSFFIDAKVTMLVTGSRGAGKTSLLSSLMLELLQDARVIVQEDTLELPVPYLKQIGYNVQRLKTRSPIGISEGSTEVSPEEALRTALRLGDSALILGEVRSQEAKVLYEAMRVGAAGNTVLGTIHADSAYSVWDRVVNDLNVPTTSFKATDLVVVARPIRFSGSLKSNRRCTQITEVKKHWTKDPEKEGGLLDLMLYDARSDSLELLEDNLKESELFEKIRRISGLSLKQIWNEIRMIANAKLHLVELKNRHDIPELLEAEYTSQAHTKLSLMKDIQIQEDGKPDYDSLLENWKEWIEKNLVKSVLEKRKLRNEEQPEENTLLS